VLELPIKLSCCCCCCCHGCLRCYDCLQDSCSFLTVCEPYHSWHIRLRCLQPQESLLLVHGQHLTQVEMGQDRQTQRFGSNLLPVGTSEDGVARRLLHHRCKDTRVTLAYSFENGACLQRCVTVMMPLETKVKIAACCSLHILHFIVLSKTTCHIST
jgi:hypothetical protein